MPLCESRNRQSQGDNEMTYVLIKRGYYYRPDAKGYTGLLREAGHYDEGDAKYRCSMDKGITRKLRTKANRFAPEYPAYDREIDLLDEIENLRAQIPDRDALEMALLCMDTMVRITLEADSNSKSAPLVQNAIDKVRETM